MRLRIAKNARFSWVDHDLGGGWKITTEKHGSLRWYCAMLLESPGGYVVNRLYEKFGTYREAKAWVKWQREILGG